MRTFGTARPVGTAKALLGEGPRWDADAGRLLWVDIDGGALYVGERRIECGSKVGAAAPWSEDVALVALADALVAVDLRDGAVRHLVDIPHAQPGMRCNDGACDPQGRFWIGTMGEDAGAGALYRYDGDLRLVLPKLTLSNGLGWDPSGRRMYLIDSPTQRVDVLDFDGATGEVSGRRPFAEVSADAGTPDGLTVDDEGGVWVALWGGGAVWRYAPDGTLDGRVDVPVARTTACCFAGDRLYVTTDARDDPDPLAGRLFALDVPFTGPPAQRFTG